MVVVVEEEALEYRLIEEVVVFVVVAVGLLLVVRLAMTRKIDLHLHPELKEKRKL